MKKIFLSLIVIVISANSCKKVLDKKPLNIISDDAVWSDPTLIDSYLTECYSEMTIFTNDEVNDPGFAGDMWFPMFTVNELSDEAKANWVDDGYGYKFGNLKIQGGLLEWWPYNTIRELNEFIARVPASPLAASVKSERIAEARFLRAFCYFGMVKRYGGVPLITTAQNATDPTASLYPTRNKEEDVYKFIISEMDAVNGDLPVTVAAGDLGRPSKYAALALECRAALYAGSIAQFGTVQLDGVVGINQTNASVYYQKTYDIAQEIVSSGAFSLYNNIPNDKVANYRNLFLDKTNNPEVIFSKRHNNIDPRTGGAGWGYDFFQSPAPQAWGAGNQDAPYLEMVEEYENVDGSSTQIDPTSIQQGEHTTDQLFGKKDPRFAASIYTQNTVWKGNPLQMYRGLVAANGSIQYGGSYMGVLASGAAYFAQVGSNTGFGVLKYLDETSTANVNWGTSSQDYIVFRYGEVLLNLAEAAFELGKPSDALNAVNQIRARAGVPLLSSVTRDQIRHERKIELAFEGHRYWDLRRWRLAVSDLTRNFSGLQYVYDPATTKFKIIFLSQVDGTVVQPTFFTQNYYFPITLTRTANNKNLVENPGY